MINTGHSLYHRQASTQKITRPICVRLAWACHVQGEEPRAHFCNAAGYCFASIGKQLPAFYTSTSASCNSSNPRKTSSRDHHADAVHRIREHHADAVHRIREPPEASSAVKVMLEPREGPGRGRAPAIESGSCGSLTKGGRPFLLPPLTSQSSTVHSSVLASLAHGSFHTLRDLRIPRDGGGARQVDGARLLAVSARDGRGGYGVPLRVRCPRRAPRPPGPPPLPLLLPPCWATFLDPAGKLPRQADWLNPIDTAWLFLQTTERCGGGSTAGAGAGAGGARAGTLRIQGLCHLVSPAIFLFGFRRSSGSIPWTKLPQFLDQKALGIAWIRCDVPTHPAVLAASSKRIRFVHVGFFFVGIECLPIYFCLFDIYKYEILYIQLFQK